MVKLYLDTTTVVDICWEEDSEFDRHQEALQLVDLCGRHFGDLELVASMWTRIEAQGVIYGKLLEKEKNIKWEKEYRGHKRANRNPRTYFPPFEDLLKKSVEVVDAVFSSLSQECRFRELNLLADSNSNADILFISHQLASFTAIFPPDSLHLALAINELVDFFVVSDADFLDKIRWAKHMEQIQALFIDRAFPNDPPAFEAAPLKLLKGTHVLGNKSILQLLSDRGFI